MKVEDVTDTLKLALTASGCDMARVEHKPRLLSDNGPCYIASDKKPPVERISLFAEVTETIHSLPPFSSIHGVPGQNPNLPTNRGSQGLHAGSPPDHRQA